MSQKIHFVKADPSGNTTIIVLDPVEPDQRGPLSKKLLDPACVGAEQVAFLSSHDSQDGVLRIDMMGGEFCGNASRSAAAYMTMIEQKVTGTYTISCSGCQNLLQAKVTKGQDNDTYAATIEMPLPQEIEAVIVDVGGMPVRFFRVDLDGIVHFVHMTNHIQSIDTKLYWDSIRAYVGHDMPDALGLLLYDVASRTMLPAVYVRETDTLYWEQSCGSGTAALGAVMACMTKQDFSAAIQQPGGVLTVEALLIDGILHQVCIGGPVTITDTQEIIF